MKTTLGLSGALAASLALTGAACADAPVAPTAAIDRQATRASARLISDEGSRLAAAVSQTERRAQLTAALNDLSRALDAGDAPAIARALSVARDRAGAIEFDADRDALRLTLDAVEQSVGRIAK